jgi:hypothetical protein
VPVSNLAARLGVNARGRLDRKSVV